MHFAICGWHTPFDSCQFSIAAQTPRKILAPNSGSSSICFLFFFIIIVFINLVKWRLLAAAHTLACGLWSISRPRLRPRLAGPWSLARAKAQKFICIIEIFVFSLSDLVWENLLCWLLIWFLAASETDVDNFYLYFNCVFPFSLLLLFHFVQFHFSCAARETHCLQCISHIVYTYKALFDYSYGSCAVRVHN